MYPFLFPELFGYTLAMYDLMIVIGVFLMLLYIGNQFEKKNGYTRKEANRLLVLILISLGVALISSYLFDGIFHSIKEGELTFGSVTFIGGLIGGIVSFLILLKYAFDNEKKNTMEIMNTVITGVVLAHAFGRIGCFLAGCCFGIPTDSILGVVFPHGHAAEKFPGTAIYPTQLFESLFLFALFFVLHNVKKIRHHEVETYLIAYGTWRFFIEFIRGDDRGSFLPFITTQYNQLPSPSQYMSFGMILLGGYLIYRRKQSKQKDQ